jgi:hypothetical protein
LIASTYEEASLFALFKSSALVGTQRGDEADFKCIQVAIAIGWKHLNERLRSDGNKERTYLANSMTHVEDFGLPWETMFHLHGSYVLEVCLSLRLEFF